jgi:hypothetical protein
MPTKIGGYCAVSGCDAPFYSKSYCVKHYQRWRKHGDPTVNLARGSWTPNPGLLTEAGGRGADLPVRQGLELVRDQILSKCSMTQEGCWEWGGAVSEFGYGHFTPAAGTRPLSRLTHRALFTALVREPDPELVLDHLCRNPPCCNPAHLEEVTQFVNTIRGVSPIVMRFWSSECGRGHPFDDENTYITAQGGRHCRACARITRRLRHSMAESVD